MKEYIEREALINTLKLLYCRDCEGYEKYGDISCRACRTGDTLAMVEDFLAADVVERVRGEWIEYQVPHIICCSECDWGTSVDDKNEYNFCPNCGADMRGEKHEQ